MSTYLEEIKTSMDFLAKDPKTIFLGYNVRCGYKGGKTLTNVNEQQLIETPVAEGLMMSMAVGLSIAGFKPVVYFERYDFILNAVDAIVNHLDKIQVMSKNQYKPKVIIRVVEGNKNNPLFTGITHTSNYTEAFKNMVNFPVVELSTKSNIQLAYKDAYNSNSSYMIIEKKDLYNENI